MARTHYSKSTLASGAWEEVRAAILEDIASARAELEMDLDDRKTAKVRGRIAALNGLLSRAKPAAASEGRQSASGALPPDDGGLD